MKLFLIFASVAVVLVGSFNAGALAYNDIQYRNAYADEGGGAITGTFNIVNPGSSTYTISGYGTGNGTFSDQGGYVLGTDLVSLVASFYIRDDSSSSHDGREKVDINLGGGPQEINDLSLVNGGRTYISFGGSSALITFLENNGTLRYRIEAEKGDFKVEYAMLTASTGTLPSHLVPDGGTTLCFLGFSLLGLFGAGRSMRTKE